LRHRIGFAIGGNERRQDQCAARQRAGIAQRRDADIDPRTAGDERRQCRRYDHGGDIARAGRALRHPHPHAVEHGAERLLRERRIAQAVAGGGEADDETIADELIVAHPLDRGDILDARLRKARRRGQC
jgi:hypothetical protein